MRIPSSTVLAAAVILSASLLNAQSTPPAAPPHSQQPCTTSPQPQPCTTPSANSGKGSTANPFPFPGETSAPPDSPKSVSPESPSAPASQSAPNRFPFPGEDSPAAPQPGVPASSSSSSSSSSTTAPPAFPEDDTNTPDPNADTAKPAAPEGRRLLKRVNPVGTKLQSADEREAEDLSVANFYTDQGNLQGAYLRAKDAAKIMPDDPDAHCALARAAVKVNKRDEAVAEFNACLKLDPVEKEAKDARHELARLK